MGFDYFVPEQISSRTKIASSCTLVVCLWFIQALRGTVSPLGCPWVKSSVQSPIKTSIPPPVPSTRRNSRFHCAGVNKAVSNLCPPARRTLAGCARGDVAEGGGQAFGAPGLVKRRPCSALRPQCARHGQDLGQGWDSAHEAGERGGPWVT